MKDAEPITKVSVSEYRAAQTAALKGRDDLCFVLICVTGATGPVGLDDGPREEEVVRNAQQLVGSLSPLGHEAGLGGVHGHRLFGQNMASPIECLY